MPPGVIWGSNNNIFYQIRLVTWTTTISYVIAKSFYSIWLGLSCRCTIGFWNFHFWPRSQLRAKKRLYWWISITGNQSTFQRVDKLYSRMWLGMSCRCAIRCRHFHFIPRGQKRVVKRRFLFSVKFITWSTYTFSGEDNRYSKIGLSISCRWAVNIRNFCFAPWGHMRVKQ